ncbi:MULTISPECIES: rod shape-determining protein MreD [Anaerococcus]|jgi:rod shape-determining protein mreD|uniref:Rod shape-determining protein MreD n=1 Tax=Anaerococcus nagyae TaxID=1755241 RepID=A0A3E2TJG5_9FIRM|nr:MULTISPECIES: rod shape-determining protein MreD [Anaerococcus]MBP2069300.1 rod shape-determining protein MreD [Anaerococcus nagyae]MDU1829278.1 rod shape-determining protein MreD [Anaerococcus sp.]MDU1865315.1 rod shape-determining protein MreD [Anaerococcus sp.]MDU2354737.1 rod shape-determining protein MreD [Anaerococcus sp.]MDU2565948.1 rod shape-determining protein MreD [Anaerococcus sp.]
MNKFKTFLVLFISFILQTTIFSKIDIFGANINLLIPATVVLSQVLGKKIGSYGGLIVGLIEDFLFTNLIGVRALSYFLIGSIVANERFKFSKDKTSGIVLTFLMTILNFLILSALYYLIRQQTSFANYLPIPLLIEAILNALIYLLYKAIVKKIMYIPTYSI